MQSACASLVLSHLDYCNSIFFGLPDCEMAKLQKVQNCAAKLILNKTRFDSASQALRELHWLPIRERVNFKIAVLVFRCLHNSAPMYLQELLSV